jgi:tRNA U38,U39,U40 pseudouridine synthase TruA
MMGLLIDIGRGYYKKEKILEVLDKIDPSISHRVAEPSGLYLYKVTY